MERLFHDESTTKDDRKELGFALARFHEQAGNDRQVFSYLNEANRLHRASLEYSPEFYRGYFEQLQSVFSPDFVAQHSAAAHAKAHPIFIVGMPRSGTTLAEHILASHSKVQGGGEMTHLNDLCLELAQHKGKEFPACVGDTTNAEIHDIGRRYLERSRRGITDPTVYVADKMPLNTYYLGMIAILFPHARIVHCTRDAMDNCFSMYKTFLLVGNEFSYDQTELGHFYRMHERSMQHWSALLADSMYELSYESLVSDTEQQVRQLLEHCELEFQADCLAFQNSARKVSTASATQVREPIYQRSVASWRRFEQELEPLCQALGSDSD